MLLTIATADILASQLLNPTSIVPCLTLTMSYLHTIPNLIPNLLYPSTTSIQLTAIHLSKLYNITLKHLLYLTYRSYQDIFQLHSQPTPLPLDNIASHVYILASQTLLQLTQHLKLIAIGPHLYHPVQLEELARARSRLAETEVVVEVVAPGKERRFFEETWEVCNGWEGYKHVYCFTLL